MIEAMPRHRPDHLHKEITRHGVVAWYFRQGKGPRVRIRGEYGSDEFKANYQAANSGGAAPQRGPVGPSGTMVWLTGRYMNSAAWGRLSPATQSQRANIYKRVCKSAGEMPYAAVVRKHIKTGVNDRAATPFAANDFLKAMRGLFGWAVMSDFITDDPTTGVAGFPHKTEGFHVWTEEEIARFESAWPVGTRERLALSILLYTGLRRGDAAMLGRQHVKDGVITFRTAKTSQTVTLPVLPQLAEVIAATKTGDLTFIATPSGAPMTKESFGNWFREACNTAGVTGAAHGLRKACATRFANCGFTEAELESWFGWRGGRMASLYTRQADRVRLARDAMKKLATSIPAPGNKVRAQEQKT
jgi:integrase